MSIDKEILENIFMRSMGILGKEKTEEMAKISGINLLPTGEIEISKPYDEALRIFINNIIKEGGIVAKIAMKNMSKQYNFPMPKDI